MTHACTCGSRAFLIRADLYEVGVHTLPMRFRRRRSGALVMCVQCEKVWIANTGGLTEPRWIKKDSPATSGPPVSLVKNEKEPARNPLDAEPDLKWRMRR